MVSRDRRISALSAKPKYVARLTVDDVLAAMAAREKPAPISKQDLRHQAEAALQSFRGDITRLPTVDPAARARAREARRSAKQARKRRSSDIKKESV
jgi:hypothetical protein